MNFLIGKSTRKNHIRQLTDCSDYCITAEGTVIMRCPVDGTLASLPPANKVISPEPLTVDGAFQFPCEGFHAFVVRSGEIQSSAYIWPNERVPIEGFDAK